MKNTIKLIQEEIILKEGLFEDLTYVINLKKNEYGFVY